MYMKAIIGAVCLVACVPANAAVTFYIGGVLNGDVTNVTNDENGYNDKSYELADSPFSAKITLDSTIDGGDLFYSGSIKVTSSVLGNTADLASSFSPPFLVSSNQLYFTFFNPIGGKINTDSRSFSVNLVGDGIIADPSDPLSIDFNRVDASRSGASLFRYASTLSFPGPDAFYSTQNGHSLGARLTYVGLTPSAVPEPATWAMMIGGIGVAGGAMRRRRATVSKVTYA